MERDDTVAGDHYHAALRLYRDLGSRLEPARVLHNLGYLALHQGDREQARTHFVQSLTVFRAVGQRRGAAEAVAGLAALAACDLRLPSALCAAELWGAATAVLEAEGARSWPADRAECLRYQALARSTIGVDAFEEAYAAGGRLDLAIAIGRALLM